MTNLPKHMQDRYEERDGFIIKKGETDPVIFAAMESIKAQMRKRDSRAPSDSRRSASLPRWQLGHLDISDRD